MILLDPSNQISISEDSCRQFKADIRKAESLAAEMVAFANSQGGTIFIGEADGGIFRGLVGEDVICINQLVSNAASLLVPSPLTNCRSRQGSRYWTSCASATFLDVYKRELPEAADELIKNAENIASTVASLSQVLAWLVTQERVSLAALRSQLLPLDQFPGAFIDELNERALDLTGDIALEESGEEIIIAKEVLFEVIANLE